MRNGFITMKNLFEFEQPDLSMSQADGQLIWSGVGTNFDHQLQDMGWIAPESPEYVTDDGA